MAKRVGNALGAFSDGAILFPLIAALSSQSGFSSALLFASAGVAYLWAGAWFRIPMSVQPLKAIAIAAVVSGTSFAEVRWAGAVVGLFCLAMLLLRAERFADRVPNCLIHGIQAGLGFMLVRKALEESFNAVSQPDGFALILISGACVGAWVLSRRYHLSMLGLLAAAGALFGISLSPLSTPVSSTVNTTVRWDMIFALALPQIVLTSTNSVLATRDVARRYFGERAHRVSISRLLTSIGLGNLIASAVGGLPFCHGSGGVTAHFRGGSSHWSSNLIIGGFCLALAAFQLVWGRTTLNYPPLLLGILLGVVGYHHIKLAEPSWRTNAFRPTLIVMGSLAVFSQNLLWAATAGTITFIATQFFYSRKVSI